MSGETKVYIENFSKDYVAFKVFAIVVITASILAVVGMFFRYVAGLEESNNVIWVVDENHRPYKAEKSKMYAYQGRAFELEQLVHEFYARAYEYELDDYHENIEGALNLLGHSKENFALWVEDEDLENNMVQSNWRFKAKVDSVLWDFDSTPVRCVAFGKQTIITKRKIVVRNMHTSFILYDLKNRSYENAFGAELDEWDLFNNVVIEEKRKK